MHDWTVRSATIHDADAIVDLYAAVAPEGTLRTRVGFDRAVKLQRVLDRLDGSFVAIRRGVPIGYGNARIDEPGVASVGLLVSVDVRRQGIGHALMEHAISWAREHGARRITLDVYADNVPAVRLYEALGFKLEGHLLSMAIAVEPSAGGADDATG